jgi:Holliday junction DNA helicase RuvA
MAVGILSGLDANQFIRCVEARDINSLVKLPGVGKKTAERLLIEMTDRIKQLEGQFTPSTEGAVPADPAAAQPVPAGHSPVEEAESALISLGYKPQEATKAISRVAEEGMSSQELIRLALRAMIPAN